jgi:hypothetical protein
MLNYQRVPPFIVTGNLSETSTVTSPASSFIFVPDQGTASLCSEGQEEAKTSSQEATRGGLGQHTQGYKNSGPTMGFYMG